MLAVQSEGQEIDGQPSRPIDLIKSGHLSRSSIGVNDGPSFEGPALASADRLAGGFRLRHPYLCQAVRGSPEFDALEHLGRKAQLDFNAEVRER